VTTLGREEDRNDYSGQGGRSEWLLCTGRKIAMTSLGRKEDRNDYSGQGGRSQ